MATSEDTTTPSFYEDEDNLRKLCDFLRSGEGPPVREALLMEKRVYYLKGRSTLYACSGIRWNLMVTNERSVPFSQEKSS
jgi:hypothetical protein